MCNQYITLFFLCIFVYVLIFIYLSIDLFIYIFIYRYLSHMYYLTVLFGYPLCDFLSITSTRWVHHLWRLASYFMRGVGDGKKSTGPKRQMVGLLHSLKLTWQWKFTFSNRKYIFKWWIFRPAMLAYRKVYLGYTPGKPTAVNRKIGDV